MLGRPAVAIGDVIPGAPAEQAGLMSGDVILAVNGERAENTAVISAPMYELGGQEVELLIRRDRSEEHTSELQSPMYLVCRLLLEKKKKKNKRKKQINKTGI